MSTEQTNIETTQYTEDQKTAIITELKELALKQAKELAEITAERDRIKAIIA